MADDPQSSDFAPEEDLTPEHSSDSLTNGTTKVAADRKVIAKFLISNAAAGSIIGKGGATISEFQEQSSARIQLSRNSEFFPGTADRVLSVSGPVNQVLTALHLIVGKVKSEEAVADSLLSRDGRSTQLRLLVPAALCGTLIGKAGATIKSFHEDSHAIIMVSPQDRQPAGVPDRIVKITGMSPPYASLWFLLMVCLKAHELPICFEDDIAPTCCARRQWAQLDAYLLLSSFR